MTRRSKRKTPYTHRAYEDWWSDEDRAEPLGQTIHESEDSREPKPTGVLDQHGNMIFRMPEPIGFIRNRS